MATRAWKFVRKDRKLRFSDGRELAAGMTLTEPRDAGGKIVTMPALCESGFHASVRALDALEHADVDQTHIALVELGGQVVQGESKLCGTELSVIWLADAERALHEFALAPAAEAAA